MRSFQYQIQDEIGIHARPAGKLVKLVKELDSRVTLETEGRKADGESLFGVMGLGVKQGAQVTVTVEGGDEETSLARMEEFFRENL